MVLREDRIHWEVRAFLRGIGWNLLAGEYPGGSDNELRPFYIRDPTVARDNSPSPRQHSLDTYEIDLVAQKEDIILLIEMKPIYSKKDQDKLVRIIDERRSHLDTALKDQLGINPQSVKKIIPALGFSEHSKFSRENRFVYLLVSDDYAITWMDEA